MSLAALAVVMLCGCAYGWSYMHTLHVTPRYATPVAPVPNAFDDMERAASAEVKQSEVEAVYKEIGLGQPVTSSRTLANLDKVLAVNRPALRYARVGLANVYQTPQVYGYDVMYPYYARHRAIVRLLSLKSKSEAAHGDFDAAATTAVDAIEMGSKIPHNAQLIGTLVGLACESIGYRTGVLTTDKVSAATARTLARRLCAIDREQVRFPAVVQGEARFAAFALAKVYRTPGGMKNVVALFGDDKETRSDVSLWLYAALPYDNVMSELLRIMKNEEVRAAMPFQVYVHAKPLPKSSNALVTILQPDFEKVRLKLEQANVKNRLLELKFALCAYHLEHGLYPATLAALVPSYLPTLPNDPFAYSGGMRYRLTPGRYVLYSVGPDGVDNGGKPIIDKSKTGRERYWLVDASALGDFVAGVN